MVLRVDDRLNPEVLARSMTSGCGQLVVLSVGYPPTATQRAGVKAALDVAVERGIAFGALLTGDMDEALDCLNPGDQVLRAEVAVVPGDNHAPAPAAGTKPVSVGFGRGEA